MNDELKQQLKDFIRTELRLELSVNKWTIDGTQLTVSLLDKEYNVLISAKEIIQNNDERY